LQPRTKVLQHARRHTEARRQVLLVEAKEREVVGPLERRSAPGFDVQLGLGPLAKLLEPSRGLRTFDAVDRPGVAGPAEPSRNPVQQLLPIGERGVGQRVIGKAVRITLARESNTQSTPLGQLEVGGHRSSCIGVSGDHHFPRLGESSEVGEQAGDEREPLGATACAAYCLDQAAAARDR
jgi:hypothetical protein